MIALLAATQEEAKPLLALLRAEKLLDQPFPTYGFPAGPRHPAGLMILSGMGPASAAAATRYAVTIRGAKTVINFGLCGALADAFQPGQLCRIAECVDGDAVWRGENALSAPIPSDGAWQDWRPARLATVEEPVFEPARKTLLAAHADVVDMEGFAVARTCRDLGVPCQLLKGVSDCADSTGRRDLHANLQRVSEALRTRIAAGLERLPRHRGSLMRRIADFVKVEHTVFSLPLLFAGAWIGAGGRWPGSRLLLLIVLAGLGARSLGMAMNRILDHRLDWLNPRTAGRELPSGRLSPAQAWLVAAAGLAVYLLACAALGPVCWRLSPIPAAVLISYSLLKRFTSLCHFGIGVCLAFGPLGGFVAATGGTNATPAVIMLALFTFFWISGFDIIYALQDLDADRETGVRSLPAALGSRGAQAVAAVVHLAAIAAGAALWRFSGGGFASGLAFAAAAAAFGLAYFQRLPLHVRFFPVSAIAGIAGSLIPLLGLP